MCSIYGLWKSARDQSFVWILHNYKNLQVPQVVRFQQEYIFIYKSQKFIYEIGMDPLVFAYTERLVCVCHALLYSAYAEYVLLFVPPDGIKFPRQPGMSTEVELGSRANSRLLLEILDVIESTQYSLVPGTWCEPRYRSIYYHPGPVDEGR